MNATFTPKALKIVPVKYLDGVTQLSICDEHDIQICLVEIGKENYAPYLATAPEMYEALRRAYLMLRGCRAILQDIGGDSDVIKDCSISIDQCESAMKKARGE